MLIYPHPALEKVVVDVEIVLIVAVNNAVCHAHDADAALNQTDANSAKIILYLYY